MQYESDDNAAGEALGILLDRGSASIAILVELAVDNKVRPDLPTTAMTTLARRPVTPATLAAFVAGLGSGQRNVVRRAAEALGHTGGPEALPALETTRPLRVSPSLGKLQEGNQFEGTAKPEGLYTA